MCKKRRVKCGEEHPTCHNCISRGTECKWPDPAAIANRSFTARDSSSSKSPDSTSEASTASQSIPAARHVDELRLMHRWSTSTFESLVSEISDDREIWRVEVPEVATRYDYLLSSIFALTAFEMAHENPQESTQHISTALEYQAHAFGRFRNDLMYIDPDAKSHDPLLYCSILLMVLALASSTQPALRGSMLDNTLIHFELVRGMSVVVMKKPEVLKAHPLFRKVPDMMTLARTEYSERFAEASKIMTEINESRAPGPDNPQSKPSEYLACKYGLWWLEYLTATCQEMKHRGFVLSWVSLAGDDFTKSLKAKDSVSLLALMWWGVLLNPLGYDYWYGEEYGSTLAGEVAELLSGFTDPRYEELIRLADDEVGVGRAAAALKPGSKIEPLDVQSLTTAHYMEDSKRHKEDGGLGNIPSEVMKYTGHQNAGLFTDDDDRRRVRERLLAARMADGDKEKDSDTVDGLAERFDAVNNFNPIGNSQT
ncbi:hypothetical protein CBER1_00193 [Cercospora berteroae]|uniref:Zn(2)-C6 fungal-type domain-containing protein n=1 Tax=Cercospora berteroae TaxID=357750 RepID=A0A2S6CDN0_9PEZI|nr:hypothetical protein CBER1_00193 [Cercospora berteroae]